MSTLQPGPDGVTRCRSGRHVIDPDATPTSEGRRCYWCRVESHRAAQARYEGTVKGVLTKVRFHSGEATADLGELIG